MARRALVASLLSLPSCLALAACGGGAAGNGLAGTPVAAFLADLEVDDHRALYVVDADGHRARVSGPNAVGEGVYDFAWSPDHTKLAYVDDSTVSGERDVFVVSAGGETPTNLTGAHIPGFNAFSPTWSPDGTRILVTGTFGVGADFALGTIPAAGGAVATISPPGAVLYSYVDHWSPDSTAVAFEANVAGEIGFWLAEADGSSTKKVSGTLVAGGGVKQYQFVDPWAADSSRLAFRADKTTKDRLDVYAVKRDGTGLVNVSASLPSNFDVYDIKWSPVGATLAFTAQRDGFPYDSHVYATDGKGGALLQVSDPNGDGRYFRWRPDGQKLAYIDGSNPESLRLTDPVTGVSTLLATLSGNVTQIDDRFAWSPDGARVAYLAGEWGAAGSQDDHFRLFSVAPGQAPALLSTTVFGPAGTVRYFKWAPDGQRIVFSCELLVGEDGGVYTAPAAGGGDTLESAPGENADSFGVTSDSAHVVWIEGKTTGGYSMHAAGPGGTAPLVPVTPAFTDFNGFDCR